MKKIKVAEVLVSQWLKRLFCLMFASAAFSVFSCQEPCIEINMSPWSFTVLAVLEWEHTEYIESGWRFEEGVQKNWITWETQYDSTKRTRTVNYFINEENYADTVYLLYGDSVVWREKMILDRERHDQIGYTDKGVSVRIYKK